MNIAQRQDVSKPSICNCWIELPILCKCSTNEEKLGYSFSIMSRSRFNKMYKCFVIISLLQRHWKHFVSSGRDFLTILLSNETFLRKISKMSVCYRKMCYKQETDISRDFFVKNVSLPRLLNLFRIAKNVFSVFFATVMWDGVLLVFAI